MYRIKCLPLIVAVSALVATVATPSGAFAGGSAPVTVVNTNPIPVSVSGPISVNTSNPLAVTGSVSVTGSVTVAQQPFLGEFSIFDNHTVASYLVPEGQTVIIQYVNVTSSTEGDCVIDVNTPLAEGGTSLGPRFRLNVRTAANSNWKQLSTEVLIPASAGKRIDVQCSGNDATVLATGYVLTQ